MNSRFRGPPEYFPAAPKPISISGLSNTGKALSTCYGLAPLDPETAVTTFAEVHSERPLERTIQGLRMGLHRTLGEDSPFGHE